MTSRPFVPSSGRHVLFGLGLERFFGDRIRPRPLPQNLPGCGTSRPPIQQQDVGHLLAGNGAIGVVPHQGRVAHGAEIQTAAGPLEGVYIPEISRCFEGMRDEDDSGVRSDPPADDRGVRRN